MKNDPMVKNLVAGSGYKLHHVARVLGISSNTLRLKLNGTSEFKVGEAQRLAELLGLSTEQRDACFFGTENNTSN